MSLVTGSWLLDALVAALLLLYWYRRLNFFFWEKLGVPYLKPSSFLANMAGLVVGRQHVGDPIYDCYLEAGDAPFMGMFAFGNPLLMVKDPGLLARILETDFPSFSSRNFAVNSGSDSLLAKSIFGVNGDKWRALRNSLAPAFTPSRIKEMFPLMETVGEDLVQHLGAEVEKGAAVDAWQASARYAAHALCALLLGADVRPLSLCEDGSPLRARVLRLMRRDLRAQLSLAVSLLAPRLFRLLPLSFTSQEEETFLYLTIVQMMNERRQKGIVRPDMLDTLMRLRLDQASNDSADSKTPADTDHIEMDDEAVVGNIVAFLIGGLDTSVSTLTHALYELAANQQIQERVRLDARGAIARHGGGFTYEALAAMSELDNVIDETMRLHPPVNFLDRRATRPFQLPGSSAVLPAGTAVVVSVLGLHRDPRYWHQPELFMPERFASGGGSARPGCAFLPYGGGPRQCLGLRVAQMQMKIALAKILLGFRVSVTEKTPAPVAALHRKLIRRPRGEFQLRFQKIP